MIKNHFSKFKILCIFVFCFVLFGVPTLARAAVLYLSSSSNEYHQGDTFAVDIRLNSENEYINAVESRLTFPADILEVKDLSLGDSVLNLWIQTPKVSEPDTISFSGGVPGGYNGADSLLAKIIFSAKKSGPGEVRYQPDSQVLLNDGLGTKANLLLQGLTLNILAGQLELPKDEWQEAIKDDIIPPELFKIEIHQAASIFDGKYFLVFSTNDKQTGVDYYEVLEGQSDWQRAESPYLLTDQKLQGIIKVKAVDKAGNERIAEIKPPAKPLPYWLMIIIFLLLVGLAVSYWLIKNIKKIFQ